MIGRGPNGELAYRRELRRRRIRTLKRVIAWAMVIGGLVLLSGSSYLAWHAIFAC